MITNMKGFFLVLLFVATVSAMTYNVTSSSCSGPGGLYEAVALANANPGADIIVINPGLVIVECPRPPKPDDSYLLITESVQIKGSSSKYHGNNIYFTADGNTNPLYTNGVCPSSSSWTGVKAGDSLSLFQIGRRNSTGISNLGVEVTIEDFNVDDVSQFAQIRDNTKLILRNIKIENVRDVQYCNRPAIKAFYNASLVLESCELSGLTDFRERVPGSHIEGEDGKLEIYNSFFHDSLFRYAVGWGGNADIVSSRFISSQGLWSYGSGLINIINSIFVPSPGSLELKFTDGFLVSGGGVIQFKASTVVYALSNCRPWPSQSCVWNAGISTATIQAFRGSVLFFDSALHVQTINPDYSPAQALLLEKRVGNSGFFAADNYTFIQPLAWQNASSLRLLTNQDFLLTGEDALPVTNLTISFFEVEFAYPNSVTPIVSGARILVDRIPNAQDGGVNQLRDPRGNFILKDAIGNPRVDVGNQRSIGAVQNSVIPYMFAFQTNVTTNMALTWTVPLTASITSYDICYGTAGAVPTPGITDTTCPGVLLSSFTTCRECTGGEISGIPAGVRSWYLVRSFSGSPQPWSKAAVVVTPFVLTYNIGNLNLTQGQEVLFSPTIEGLLFNKAFKVISGALPTGLNLHSSTGIISGTPTMLEKSNGVIMMTGITSFNTTASTTIGFVVNTVPSTVTTVPSKAVALNPSVILSSVLVSVLSMFLF